MTSTMRVRKRPVEVEAMLLHAGTEAAPGDLLDPNTRAHASIAGWMMGHGFRDFKVTPDPFSPAFGLTITTLEGPMFARPGWWIIRGVHGEFYPCDPAVFAETYDVLGEA